MKSARQRYFELCLLFFLLGLFIFRTFVPAWKTLNTDFRNYYVAAWLYRNHSSMLRVYDFTWFQRQKDHAGIGECVVGFVPDTLLSALPIVPFATLPPIDAKRCWLVVNLIMLVMTPFILSRITQLGWCRSTILLLLAIEPLSTNFLYGQMHFAVFFLLALAVWCLENKRSWAAGFCIALAAALKLYPAIFISYFLRKKQWSAAAGTLLGLIILAGWSIYLFGWDVHAIYVREILPVIGRGENIDPYAAQWNSLTAFFHHAFIFEPGLNPQPLLNSPYLYVVMQPLCQALIFVPALWVANPDDSSRHRIRLELATFIAMLIALSTGPTPYHLCVLILTAALGIDSLLSRGRRREACILAGLYALTCLPWPNWAYRNSDGWRLLAAMPRLYPMLMLAVFCCWCAATEQPTRERLRIHRRENWAFGALMGALAFWGSLQAFRHQVGMFENYSHRLVRQAGILLQGEPTVGAQKVYFTRMPGGRPNFATWEQGSDRTRLLFNAEDAFHPTAPGQDGDLWVESVRVKSSIAKVATSDGNELSRPSVLVTDGEEPSISTDRKLLAFIREEKGRGALWIKNLTSTSEGSEGQERRLVDDQFDVWEPNFEPGNQRIIFTAAPQGEPSLFLVDVSSKRVVPVAIPPPVRYPAFSPDGEYLAYSRFDHGMWHLFVRNLNTNQSHQVAGGDCNAVSATWTRISGELIYATDCGRGLEMTALVKVDLAR